MTATHAERPTVTALYTGLTLTVVALAVPYIDRATGNVLAGHIRAGYPGYDDALVDEGVTVYLTYLTIVGVLGIAGWLWTTWAAVVGKPWARVAATTLFVLGTSVALVALLIEDTSGDTGLPPLLGWVGMLPCAAGLVAVALLWKRRP